MTSFAFSSSWHRQGSLALTSLPALCGNRTGVLSEQLRGPSGYPIPASSLVEYGRKSFLARTTFFGEHSVMIGDRAMGKSLSMSSSGPVKTRLLNLLKNQPIPTAVGLERNGEVLLKPFCPPYYRNMREAVLAFVDYKYGAGRGTLRDGGAATAWQDGSRVQAGIPPYSDHAIEATIAYCDYVYRRYGRFPANSGPFRTLLAYQAHHLDREFYATFYKRERASASQSKHRNGLAVWVKPSCARPTSTARF